MFFLLASFMMVSLTMTKQKSIKVNLPVATATQSDFKPDMINLGVNSAGDLYFDKEPMSLPALDQRLKERYAKDSQTPVYISGDSATPWAEIVKALNAARSAGFTKVAVNVKAGSGPSGPAAPPVPASAPAPLPPSR